MIHEAGVIRGDSAVDDVLVGGIGCLIVLGIVKLLYESRDAMVAFSCLVDRIVILGFGEEHVVSQLLGVGFFCIGGHLLKPVACRGMVVELLIYGISGFCGGIVHRRERVRGDFTYRKGVFHVGEETECPFIVLGFDACRCGTCSRLGRR